MTKVREHADSRLISSNCADTVGSEANLEWRLQVVFVALGKELVGVGCRSVLVEVLQVLQVRSEVLLSVAAGSCEDELGLQLDAEKQTAKEELWCLQYSDATDWLIVTMESIDPYLE